MLKNPLVIIFAVIVIILIGVGGVFYLNNSKGSETMMKNEDVVMKDQGVDSDDKMMKGDSVMMEDSRYVEYSNEVFENSSKNQRILFFYANWCPTCRPADENFKENLSIIPEDVILIRVNYNDSDTDQDEKDLAKKYKVTYQHTFVQIDASGKEITKWNGGQIEQLLAKIK